MRISRRHIRDFLNMPVVRVTGAVAALAGIAWGGHTVLIAWQDRGTPSCSWPVQVRGAATGQQVGLVRCYLRGLATRDAAMLMTVADNIPPVRITAADLAYSADARAGMATATFTPSPVDSTYVLLQIGYANGARENTGIMNMEAMGGPSGWRMTIGTPVSNSSAPPPARAS